ncbi:DUF916 and DUF3324 domain-containing protein [Enterococcus faecium]|nr:DUF916 and DUF3324 domain-containing protein [Enterococcus faecium]
MKKNRKYLIGLFAFVFFIFLSSHKIYADNGDFSISPLDPKTGEVQSSYYDLTVTPGQKVVLKVKIHNNSDESKTIQVEANNGTTNDNGITSYLKTNKRDSSLKIAFEDIAKVEKNEIIVPSKGTEVAIVSVEIPNEKFIGDILGGLHFFENQHGNKRQQNSTITNHIAYTIGVVLKESEELVLPKMAMQGVILEQRNYRNYMSVVLQNSMPTIIKKLTVKAQVYKKDTDNLQYEASNNDMRMAPNSNFKFGISLEDKQFIPGEYTMKVSGNADGVPFDFSQNFTVPKDKAEKLNSNAVFVNEKENSTNLIYILIILVILVIILIRMLVEKRRMNNET